MSHPSHLVVMGVAGSGKSTVAAAVADLLGWDLVEGDDLHSARNLASMAAGTPLTDADRQPWLLAVRDAMTDAARHGRRTVVSCSALRRDYRDVLREALGGVRLVHLEVSPEVLAERLAVRPGHFMPAILLRSQLDTLEPLGECADDVTLPADAPVDDLARAIVERVRAAD